MERLLLVLPLLAYGYVAFAYLLPGVVGERGLERARPLAVAGALVHLVELTLSVMRGHRPGISMALSATALTMVVAWVWLVRKRQKPVAMLIGPLAVVLLGTSEVIPEGRVMPLSEAAGSAWLPVHLGLMFSGLVGFVLSFAVGVLYLYVRGRLKQKDFRQLGRMPSLETLDRIQFRATLFGFVFLTLGIGAGGAWAAATMDRPWALDPIVWFTVLTWLWYGIALQVRLVAGWRGRWSALFSIVGFGGLLATLALSQILFRSWHTYG